MKKPLLVIGLLAAIVYACNQPANTLSHLLNTGKLPTQVFSIDITKDTVLHTKNGALIRIPHGALSSGNNTVQLEIKEAYTMQDILKGGLTTMSNGQALSSGGMIYINAVGGNEVKFNQPISIATPTPYIESGMQLYKGVLQTDSAINWVDPKPLGDTLKPLGEKSPVIDLNHGEVLFTTKCAPCHGIGRDLTGPDLAHILKRPGTFLHSFNNTDLYSFTRNPAKAMANDVYYTCLKNKFNRVMMTANPDLTNKDLNNLYGYIENESERKHLPVPDNGIRKCLDSCLLYWEAITHWSTVKARLEKETVDIVKVKTAPTKDTTGPSEKVVPVSNTSLYYQFTVDAFGWYNVDMLLKTNVDTKPAELRVRIQRQASSNFSVYLIIPSVKLLVAGGQLENGKDQYGFHNVDGSIPLPQNEKAFIIALGEQEDQIIYAKTEFITKEKQEFTLTLTTITKKAFQQQMDSLQMGDLTITANDTKNAAELRTAVKELKNAEQLKPTNCDCNCFFDNPVVDSTDAGLKNANY